MIRALGELYSWQADSVEEEAATENRPTILFTIYYLPFTIPRHATSDLSRLL